MGRWWSHSRGGWMSVRRCCHCNNPVTVFHHHATVMYCNACENYTDLAERFYWISAPIAESVWKEPALNQNVTDYVVVANDFIVVLTTRGTGNGTTLGTQPEVVKHSQTSNPILWVSSPNSMQTLLCKRSASSDQGRYRTYRRRPGGGGGIEALPPSNLSRSADWQAHATWLVWLEVIISQIFEAIGVND